MIHTRIPASVRILSLLFPFAACFASTIAVADAPLAVHVDASGGAPRITVNGKPVRARMFWGAPGARPMHLGSQGQEVSFEFTPTEDESSSATMHLRFGQVPGVVDLDNFRIVEIGTGREVIPVADFEGTEKRFHADWSVWPPDQHNTIGTVKLEPGRGQNGTTGLHVRIAAPRDGHWPDFHIYRSPTLALKKSERYRVSFWAKAMPPRDLTIAFYRPGKPYVCLGGPGGVFENQIKLAGKAGAPFVSFPVSLPWPKPGNPVDWTPSDRQCQTVLDANPSALLVPRIGVDAPRWWLDAHPDARMAFDKPGADQDRAVVASPEYRRDAAERLAALVRHLEEKFGGRVAGYHPCGQNTGEFFYQNTWQMPLNGYAPADQTAWRSWLRAQYKTDSGLQTAWHDTQVALDSAAVPSAPARRAFANGVFRDPTTERPLIDFAQFQQDAMADCVCHLAHAVREASAGRKLVVFFYGYVFEFGPVRNGPPTCGHYGLSRVLKCPDIDVLCSPISYFDRGLGQSAPAMTAAESVALAGKLWLFEDDTRTYLGTGTAPGWKEAVDTLDKTNQELLRNTAQCAVRNFGTWWMDLGATGWFNDPGMWEQMQRLASIDRPLLEHPRPFRPEVAAVIHERSMVRTSAAASLVTAPGIYEVRRPLGRMGAPYGQYLLEDIIADRVDAKMYVFLNAWCLTPAERKQLLAATRGRLKIWCFAPGYQEPERISPEAMQELTGLRLVPLAKAKALATPTGAGQMLGLKEKFGPDKVIEPLFAAEDAKPEEVLARYPDGSAAVALRHTADGWSLFVGPPGLTADLLRIAARKAGVHLFTSTDCNVYANGPYLVLHGSQAGPVALDVGRPGPVQNLLTGQCVGQGPQVTLPLNQGETLILACPKGSAQ